MRPINVFKFLKTILFIFPNLRLQIIFLVDPSLKIKVPRAPYICCIKLCHNSLHLNLLSLEFIS